MAVYKIVTVPEDVLRQKAKPVNKINAGVLRLLDNMKDTMYAYDGVGLAAPQIGVSKRVIVVDIDDSFYELINPEIIETEGEEPGTEGCLSIPNVVGVVNRAKQVKVKAINREGEDVNITANDLLARAFQHEIDHLDGILFTDKAVSIKTENNKQEE
ncbi:MAG TPA: peptide deformylase [Syntrophomonadaceae bacterium]|nr:peptide deformylase [Syntrophomonadaceae bacterium]